MTLSPGGSTTIPVATYSLDSKQTDYTISPAAMYGDPIYGQLTFTIPSAIAPALVGGQLADDVYTDGVRADTENAVIELYIPAVTVAFPSGDQLTVTFLPPPAAFNNIQSGTASTGTIMATFTDASVAAVTVPEPASIAVLGVGVLGIALFRRRREGGFDQRALNGEKPI